MSIVVGHDLAPSAYGGMAYQAGQGAYKKWLSQLEKQRRAQMEAAIMQQGFALQRMGVANQYQTEAGDVANQRAVSAADVANRRALDLQAQANDAAMNRARMGDQAALDRQQKEQTFRADQEAQRIKVSQDQWARGQVLSLRQGAQQALAAQAEQIAQAESAGFELSPDQKREYESIQKEYEKVLAAEGSVPPESLQAPLARLTTRLQSIVPRQRKFNVGFQPGKDETGQPDGTWFYLDETGRKTPASFEQARPQEAALLKEQLAALRPGLLVVDENGKQTGKINQDVLTAMVALTDKAMGRAPPAPPPPLPAEEPVAIQLSPGEQDIIRRDLRRLPPDRRAIALDALANQGWVTPEQKAMILGQIPVPPPDAAAPPPDAPPLTAIERAGDEAVAAVGAGAEPEPEWTAMLASQGKRGAKAVGAGVKALALSPWVNPYLTGKAIGDATPVGKDLAPEVAFAVLYSKDYQKEVSGTANSGSLRVAATRSLRKAGPAGVAKMLDGALATVEQLDETHFRLGGRPMQVAMQELGEWASRQTGDDVGQVWKALFNKYGKQPWFEQLTAALMLSMPLAAPKTKT